MSSHPLPPRGMDAGQEEDPANKHSVSLKFKFKGISWIVVVFGLMLILLHLTFLIFILIKFIVSLFEKKKNSLIKIRIPFSSEDNEETTLDRDSGKLIFHMLRPRARGLSKPE